MSNQERIDNIENQLIDIRLAVSALLETVAIHQRNFEVLQRNFDSVVTEMREIQSEVREIQLDVRGLQTENRRILDILQNLPPQTDG
ncbi:hypothetical protein C6N34_000585 [Cylindrospermopsis raciborskii Cr2010]|uniref:hypothetical protein n=1 Tax=Cylindrospermopsis raciborskii TaxID=77022 RepID=UPI000E1F4FE6|nr:hypothetical protein [Cylindrospermopsis raciborskii]UJL33800.1 hypothetical protein C6N34_000585 [Cylindrospermopsis raciborskii Cr2010]